MRYVLGAFDHHHRFGEAARIVGGSVVRVGQLGLAAQAGFNDVVGRFALEDALPAGVV